MSEDRLMRNTSKRLRRTVKEDEVIDLDEVADKWEGEDEVREDNTPSAASQNGTGEGTSQDLLLLKYRSTAWGNSGSVELYQSDVNCLQPEEFLNDRVMDFWANHTLSIRLINDQDKKRIVLFSSLFYPSLVRQSSQKGNSKKGSGWTRDIEGFFEKDVIFVPVPIDSHWVLAMILWPGVALSTSSRRPKPVEGSKEDLGRLYSYVQKRNQKGKKIRAVPMIVIFDSFKELAIDHKEIARNLRAFLTLEFKERFSQTFEFTRHNLPLEVPKVLQQHNWYDCGIYVMQYFESFFHRPFLKKVSIPFPDMRDWFEREKVDGKRRELYEIIKDEMTVMNSAMLPSLPDLRDPVPDSPDLPERDRTAELKASPVQNGFIRNREQEHVVEEEDDLLDLDEDGRSREAKDQDDADSYYCPSSDDEYVTLFHLKDHFTEEEIQEMLEDHGRKSKKKS